MTICCRGPSVNCNILTTSNPFLHCDNYYCSFNCNFWFHHRNVWRLWRGSKLYIDLWWRRNQLHRICVTTTMRMWHGQLLYSISRWSNVHTRYFFYILIFLLSGTQVVHKCKMIISPDVFLVFSKFRFFGLLGESESKKWSKMTKNAVRRVLYLTNHTSYDLHLWYTFF